MPARRRTKLSRYRGSQTHGGGAKKKRRGAGHRGGRGMGGTGKRGDSKKPSIWATDYFGKKGFKIKNKTPTSEISIRNVEERLNSWVREKKAEAKGSSCHIDLGKLGYNKLIGSGKTSKKLHVVVERATPGALESIKTAGGDVELTLKEGPKAEKPKTDKKTDDAETQQA